MPFKVTFIGGSTPLVKSFRKKDDETRKSSYPQLKNVTSYTEEYRSIEDFFEGIKRHAELGHALVTGTPTREIQNESRAGLISPDQPIYVIPIDVDKLNGFANLEELLADKNIPAAMRNTSYIKIISASAEIDGDTRLSNRAYYVSAQPINPDDVKLFYRHLNLAIERVNESLKLTGSKGAINWRIDPSIVEPTRLNFIAPPIIGKGVKCDVNEDRIQLVKKKNKLLKFDFSKYRSMEADIKQATMDKLNELRKAEGLGIKRSTNVRALGNELVSTTVDQAEITGIKEDRGFIYMNLNGGDSWGYYHPVNCCEILYNFKDEPNYSIRQLLPEYYAEYKAKLKQQKQDFRDERLQHNAETNNEPNVRYLAGVNRKTGELLRITYDTTNNTITVLPAKNLFILRNFLALHGEEMPAEVPEYDVVFDPSLPYQFSEEDQVINLHHYSDVVREALNRKKQPVADVPKTVWKVILHACGGCEETAHAFINYLAYKLRTGQKAKVIWVLHGTQGTGKGLIWQGIQKIFGFDFTPRIDADQLTSENFNYHLFTGTIGLMDELDLDALKSQRKLTKRLKEIGTEDELMIRKMGVNPFKERNHCDLLIFSNERHSANLHSADRRFSVAPRQEEPLQITHEEVEQYFAEITDFANYLLHCDYDAKAATRPIINDARAELMALSRNSYEEMFNALKDGDLTFFLDNRPEHNQQELRRLTGREDIPSYDMALQEIANNLQTGRISRSALESLVFGITGKWHKTPHIFSKWLAHQGIQVKAVRVNGFDKVVKGCEINHWNISDEDKEQLRYIADTNKEFTEEERKQMENVWPITQKH